MEEVNRVFKEWNPVIEALGEGIQTILVRKYETSNTKFLLYPTFSYTVKDNFLNLFQKKYHEFVKENSIPEKKIKDKVEINYFSKIEEIIDKSSTRSGFLSNYSIWSKDHIKSYLGNGRAQIWILRTYKLDKPIMTDKARGMLYGKIKSLKLSNLEPIIEEEEFLNIINKIKKIK